MMTPDMTSMERRAGVVQALRKAGAVGVSGETLAHQLGISRAAVGKHVSALRECGYLITSTPGVGYTLKRVPNLPLPFEVYPLLHEPDCDLYGGAETGSTNDDAKALAAQGAPDKSVVLAGRQLAGRGRLGREWVSPEGGLYLSFVLRPQASIAQMASLSLIIGLGVLRAVRRLGAKDVKLKWPNDVLMPNGKLCGILLEMVAQMERVDAVIPGIGVNVNRSKGALENGAYLSDQLGELESARVAAVMIDSICGIYDEWRQEGCRFQPFAQEYVNDLSLVGDEVCVRRIDGTVEAEGVVRGIDGDGCLIVGDRHVLAGDVTLRVPEV